ncbi:MAG: 1-acyl-sn-glycerol-3-phosphate acyltransferase [Spirochaetales bacterium]|uniref:1-acyl-sn-glycerol-3-phosphate acyltransferase n=1 Tax=Candidatus Thalassospirochaeta sargassi TaxID=3119039 RepID=A0AAJ1MLZ2_9SPIO|nr:1-acyl-sn-glycerol-3-phosphate acyltransferase [Spirochaetales bacterium]
MNLKDIFFGHHDKKRIQVPRALLSSLAAAVLDYLTMILLVEFLKVNPLTAGTISMLLGLVFVYFAGRLWIYPPVPGYAVGAEAIFFAAISFLGAGIHTVALSLGLNYLPLHYVVIKAAASTLMFCWNFSMRRIVNVMIRRAHEKREEALGKYSILFPRHRGRRTFSRILLRIVLPIAFKVKISGKKDWKALGPVVVAGNHSGFVEILFMIAYGPKYLELLAAGDLPLDPRFTSITKLYNFIPVNRGNVDRKAFTACVDVLKQGGYIGLFPEGGIWEVEQSDAQKGVSWIAQLADVPVVPVGVGGLHNIGASFKKLKRPVITVGFGEPVPPPKAEEGQSRKAALKEHVGQVMNGIVSAIPEDLREVLKKPVYEKYSFGIETEAGEDLSEMLPNGESLSLFMFKPVLVNTFKINLKLKVDALQQLDKSPKGGEFALAVDEIMSYLDVNHHFFNYRFGPHKGAEIKSALLELGEAGRKYEDCPLNLTFKREYRMEDSAEELTEILP